jgi:hypothetical protein
MKYQLVDWLGSEVAVGVVRLPLLPVCMDLTRVALRRTNGNMGMPRLLGLQPGHTAGRVLMPVSNSVMAGNSMPLFPDNPSFYGTEAEPLV